MFDVKSGAVGGGLAHTLSVQGEPVRIVHEAIEDGIGNGRLWDHFVPVLDRQLGGHDRRAAPMPIVDDLQQITRLIEGDRGETPVVKDQEIDPRQGLQQPCVPAIAARERQGIEQPWHAMIEHGAIVAAGLVAERAGDPTFAEPGQAYDILPRNICSKLSFNIRIIRALVSASWF